MRLLVTMPEYRYFAFCCSTRGDIEDVVILSEPEVEQPAAKTNASAASAVGITLNLRISNLLTAGTSFIAPR